MVLSVADATVLSMLTNILTTGTFFLAAVGAVRPLTQMTWRSAVDRRIDKHVGRSRDLTCPVQREFHERKATQEEWWLQSLSRFKNRRSVGLASVVMVVAAGAMMVVTYPPIAESVDARISVPLIVLFLVAGLSYVHALHCLSVCSVNRLVFTALRGRDVAPTLNAPSVFTWLASFRGGFKALGTPNGLEVLAEAAEVQRQRGQQWVPNLTNLDDAHKYAYRLDDESVRGAFERLNDQGVLGGATISASSQV